MTDDAHLDDVTGWWTLHPHDEETAVARRELSTIGANIRAEAIARSDGGGVFLAALDRQANWIAPRHPAHLVLHLQPVDPADPDRFHLDWGYRPTLALAEGWLLEHGCPSEQLARTAFARREDPLTQHIEQRIRTAGDRFDLIDQETRYGDDAPDPEVDIEVFALLQDLDPSPAAGAAFRIQLETHRSDGSVLLREGAFPTVQRAVGWHAARYEQGRTKQLLPAPPEDAAFLTSGQLRADAARSTSSKTRPAAAPESAPGPSSTPERPRGRHRR
ncbi:hypothetical protein BIV57_07630 [Mangrovactinospora gilvigrisea]|uniref:Uncharacterized protein n=1 Tax=Mangrovactinospora gilvigrisea TaxID=1428644 RepID=A0A1J7BX72_9ACTN|nr:hypothetical protein [Mangrovactinospora gilvigrisea]OIV38073.1 hypothetical protein BIV57_07630 [Mangrovactinospora gilvigrisea]